MRLVGGAEALGGVGAGAGQDDAPRCERAGSKTLTDHAGLSVGVGVTTTRGWLLYLRARYHGPPVAVAGGAGPSDLRRGSPDTLRFTADGRISSRLGGSLFRTHYTVRGDSMFVTGGQRPRAYFVMLSYDRIALVEWAAYDFNGDNVLETASRRSVFVRLPKRRMEWILSTSGDGPGRQLGWNRRNRSCRPPST